MANAIPDIYMSEPTALNSTAATAVQHDFDTIITEEETEVMADTSDFDNIGPRDDLEDVLVPPSSKEVSPPPIAEEEDGEVPPVWELFKLLFYDPTWPRFERYCCLGRSLGFWVWLGSWIFLLTSCAAITIALIVGFIQVVIYLKHQEIVQSRGLRFYPVSEPPGGQLEFCKSSRFHPATQEYFQCRRIGESFGQQLTDIFELIETRQKSLNSNQKLRCSPGYKRSSDDGRFCAFDKNVLLKGLTCNADNQFGYTTGEPCVLLTLSKVPKSFIPRFSKNDIDLNQFREAVHHYRYMNPVANQTKPKPNFIQLACSAKLSGNISFGPVNGFDANFIPYSTHRAYVEAMVVVQFTNVTISSKGPGYGASPGEVICKLFGPNLEEMDSTLEIEFVLVDLTQRLIDQKKARTDGEL